MNTTTRGRYAAPRNSRTPIVAVLAILALLFAGCMADAEADDGNGEAGDDKTALEAARVNCAPGSTDITTGDDGTTLLIDHRGEDETTGTSLDQVVCVLFELGVPDSVVAQMDATRAMDGRQSASWDGYEVSWSYHPDTGVDMIITENGS